MKPCEPELDLWTFLEENVSDEYLRVVDITGGVKDTNAPQIVAMTNLGDMEHKFLEWISANRDTVRKNQYNAPQHNPMLSNFEHMNGLPATVGFNRLNTTDYSWGVFDEHNDELKEMIGGHEAFRKMGMMYDYAIVRLLVQMPGHFQPWHFDTHSGWASRFEELHPVTFDEWEIADKIAAGESRYDIAPQTVCDLGTVVRRIVTASEWEAGHMFEIENSFLPKWDSGDVFDLRAGLWHLSGNAGINLKMTIIITGVEQNG